MKTQDEAFMHQALTLAQQGRFTARPNPCVGCVIVKGGHIVAQGWHWQSGLPHAEQHALKQAGEHSKGATAYITLEPCVHQGRTSPCLPALIQAGIKRVVIAGADPNPLVQNRGVEALKAAGIEVQIGILQNKAWALNKGFFSRMLRQRPYVRAKMAMSIDGRIAPKIGTSQWITGVLARQDVHENRAQSSVILSTAQTVIQDNARLTARTVLPSEYQALFIPPMRVIVDKGLRVPAHAALFQEAGKIVMAISDTVSCAEEKKWQAALPNTASVECVRFSEKKGHLEMGLIWDWLNQIQMNEVWVEAGSGFLGALLQENWVDELLIYMAPLLLGSQGLALAQLPHMQTLADQIKGGFEQITLLGEDVRFTVSLNERLEKQYADSSY